MFGIPSYDMLLINNYNILYYYIDQVYPRNKYNRYLRCTIVLSTKCLTTYNIMDRFLLIVGIKSTYQ